MTIQTSPKLEPQHPPLAHDPHGNLLAVPDGTSAWRICRETTGRPREIRGPDKQPFRFSLDTTCDELVEMCGSGVYRVYALDDVGTQLVEDQIARWDLTPGARELRNASSDAALLGSLRTSGAPSAATDLRFALEAMTQMMRTNSDALRIVAESHVDLAKTIATAKGLPRNVSYVVPAAANDDDDEDEDDAPDTERPRHFVELLMPFAEKVAEMVPGLVAGKVMGVASGAKALGPTPAGSSADDDLANRPAWEARDLIDLNYASRKARAKLAAKEQQAGRASAVAALQARIVTDPALVQHLIAIRGQLTSEEIESLIGAVAVAPESEQVKFLDALKSLPVEGAVSFCREVNEAMREQAVSLEQAPKAP